MLMILDPRCGWGERSSEMFDFDPRAATCEQHDGTTNHQPLQRSLARLFCTLPPPPLVIFTASNPSAELVRLRG